MCNKPVPLTTLALRLVLFGCCCLGVGCAVFQSRPIPPQPGDILDPDPGRFEKIVLAEGLRQPMEIELLPDGRVLFVELPGDIRIFDPKTREIRKAGHLDVFTGHENGLLGSALDPNFESNGWIYLFYSPVGNTPKNHVSRFTLRGNTLDITSEKVVLEIPTQRDECCHQAGALEFGPDGCLFISVGDNTNPFASDGYSPSDYQEKRSAWDAAKSSGNTHDLRGKILRIRPEPDGTYSIPPGNLFPPDDPLARPEVYVMGCRNPFRISVDPRTGYLYWGDVGPDAQSDSKRGPRGYDEINQAKMAGNFGWPFLIADNKSYAAYDFATQTLGEKFAVNGPVNLSPNNTGHKTLPPGNSALIWYPYAQSEEFPAVGNGGRTACAGPVYHYDPKSQSTIRIPAKYDGCLFHFDWERGRLFATKLSPDGAVEWIEPFMPDHKFLRPVDMLVGPEGDLYLLEYGSTWGENKDSKLVRLQYKAGNRPPLVSASATNATGAHPLTVNFGSEGTLDKDGDPVEFKWDFGSGWPLHRKSKSPNPEFTYRRPGTYRARLTVTDIYGASNSAEVVVRAGNAPPKLTFNAPKSGDFIDWGGMLDYSILMEDAEDGDTRFSSQLQPEVFMTVDYFQKLPEKEADGLYQGKPEPPAVTLMKGTNCLNCHALDRRVTGPAFKEIADRYKDEKESAIERAIERVIKGSTGVWGNEMAMLPHEGHSPEEVRTMVSWIMSINDSDEALQTVAGTEGRIPVQPQPGEGPEGFMVLTASYRDHGAKNAERLETKEQIVLRSRRIRAADAAQSEGIKWLDGRDNNKDCKYGGFIEHGDWFRLDAIPMSRVGAIRMRVSSPDHGGRIEIRAGALDGPVIGSAEVPVTNGWQQWKDITASVNEVADTYSLWFVCLNEEKKGTSVFNVHWVEFEPREAEN